MAESVIFQGSLFGDGEPNHALVHRDSLDHGAWLDVWPAYLSDADEVFTRLLHDVPWQAERRQMWDAIVDVPRLLAFYREGQPLPHARVTAAMADLSRTYARDLPAGFATAGLCLYRDGRDSVAWHGDRIGRGRDHDTLVAIISLGSTRELCLRPRTGGTTRRYALGHGDLVVMGGSCQRTWDHAIPKTSQRVGPRISIQFRPLGVR